jgi:hypothetical protein
VSAGATVDYRSLPNQGHLLTVPAGLPEVVTWLLEKRREGNALPASTRPRPELARPGEREDGDITRSRR